MSESPLPEPIVQVRSHRSKSIGPRAPERPKAERPRRQWPLLVGSLLAVLTLAAGALLILRPRQQLYVLRSYQATAVTRSTLIETATTAGVLTSSDIRTVSAPTESAVREVWVRAGQDVGKGDLLVRLSSPDLEATRIKARDTMLDLEATQASSLRRLQSDLTAAQIDQAAAASALSGMREARYGMETLYAVGGISRAELESARQRVQEGERAVQMANTKVGEAKGALQDAQVSGERKIQAARDDLARALRALQQLDVRSPISGRVLTLSAQTGVQLGAGTALLTVASLKEIGVQLQLGEALAGRVKVGQAARITIGEESWSGEITRVSSTASSSTTQTSPTVEAEAAFLHIPAGLRLGSSATVEVQVAEHVGVLTLPREAFLSTGGEALAYVLSGGRAERREVSYGAQNDTQVEVVSGLKMGERVITSSYEAFKDQLIIITPPSGQIGQPEGNPPRTGETP